MNVGNIFERHLGQSLSFAIEVCQEHDRQFGLNDKATRESVWAVLQKVRAEKKWEAINEVEIVNAGKWTLEAINEVRPEALKREPVVRYITPEIAEPKTKKDRPLFDRSRGR